MTETSILALLTAPFHSESLALSFVLFLSFFFFFLSFSFFFVSGGEGTGPHAPPGYSTVTVQSYSRQRFSSYSIWVGLTMDDYSSAHWVIIDRRRLNIPNNEQRWADPSSIEASWMTSFEWNSPYSGIHLRTSLLFLYAYAIVCFCWFIVLNCHFDTNEWHCLARRGMWRSGVSRCRTGRLGAVRRGSARLGAAGANRCCSIARRVTRWHRTARRGIGRHEDLCNTVFLFRQFYEF